MRINNRRVFQLCFSLFSPHNARLRAIVLDQADTVPAFNLDFSTPKQRPKYKVSEFFTEKKKGVIQ